MLKHELQQLTFAKQKTLEARTKLRITASQWTTRLEAAFTGRQDACLYGVAAASQRASYGGFQPPVWLG